MSQGRQAAADPSGTTVNSCTNEPVERPSEAAPGPTAPSFVKKFLGEGEVLASRRFRNEGSSISPKSNNTRTPAGTSKPLTRPSGSSARHTVASTSTSSHQSQPRKMSTSDDENESRALSTSPSVTRKASSVKLNTLITTDKKSSALASTTPSTARRPMPSICIAASPRANGVTSRPGTAATAAAPSRNTPARPAATLSTTSPDPRKRSSGVSSMNANPRPSTRDSIRSEVSIDTVKLVEEFASKLAEKDAENEILRSQISDSELVIIQLREQARLLAVDGDARSISRAEVEDAFAKLKAEHQKTLESTEVVISGARNKLQATEQNLSVALRARDGAQADIEALESSLEFLKVEKESQLRASDEALKKALHDHAIKVGELQAAMMYQEERDKAFTALTSVHETAVTNFQLQIEELTASKNAWEVSKRVAIESERKLHASTAAALETEIQDLKSSLEASKEAAGLARAESQQSEVLIFKLQSELKERGVELAMALEKFTTSQSQMDFLQNQLADKENAISQLQILHDQRMKQLSQDFGKEIECLRRNVFFERKFEELEKQHIDLNAHHNELKVLAEESAKSHVKAIEMLGQEHKIAITMLENQVSELNEFLEEARAKHIQEGQRMKNDAAAIEMAHMNEMKSLRINHDEALQLALRTERSDFARQLEYIESSHNQILDDLTASHEATLSNLKDSHHQALDALQASHEVALEVIEVQYRNERESLRITHDVELTAIKEASATSLKTEHSQLLAQLKKAEAELQIVRSDRIDEINVTRHELTRSHLLEVDKLIATHAGAMEALKAEGVSAKNNLEQLTALHIREIEDVVAECKTNSLILDDKLSCQVKANSNLQKVLEQTQGALDRAQAESQDLSRMLAQEKMERIALLADLDAAKNIKSDLAAIDVLRADLVLTRKSHEETLSAARMSLQAKREELNLSKNSFKLLEEKLVLANGDLDLVRRSLDAFKADAQVKQGIAEADYKNLQERMTSLLEEANTKIKGLEVQVEDLVRKVEIGQKSEYELIKSIEELQKGEQEALAQLKVRNAELAELKARVSTTNITILGNSRRANHDQCNENTAMPDFVRENEVDDDHSSAALALLSKVRLTTKQIDALDREMRDRNLQLLNSITDISFSG